MSRRILAIDIRNHSLSALLLTTGMKNMVVENCTAIEINAKSETHSETEALSAALAELKSAFDTTNASVVIGLPAWHSHYRVLNLPFADEKRIRQILAFELEPILPLPVDRLISDFSLTAKEDGATVLTATTDRQYLDAVINTLVENGLRPQTVVPGGFALPTRFSHHKEHFPDQYLIMDIDGDRATLFAVGQERILTARSLPFDVSTDDTMRMLGTSIRQTLLGFADTVAYRYQPETLYVTGQETLHQMVIEGLGDFNSIKVQNIDLRTLETRIEFSPSATECQTTVPDGALALALTEAEQKADFYYHRTGSAVHNLWASYKSYLKVPMALMSVIIFLFFIGIFWELHVFNQRVGRINQEILAVMQSAFPEITTISGRPADLMKSKLEEFKKGQVEYSVSGGPALTIDILQQISDLIPKEVEVLLNRLNVSSDVVTISGETVDYNTVEDIKSRLEQSPLFKAVSITNSDRDKSGKKVRFRLKIDI